MFYTSQPLAADTKAKNTPINTRLTNWLRNGIGIPSACCILLAIPNRFVVDSITLPIMLNTDVRKNWFSSGFVSSTSPYCPSTLSA